MSVRRELRFHGDYISCVPVGSKYETVLTWIRDGAYYVEVRNYSTFGTGRVVYEEGWESEILAREDARARALQYR